MASTSVSKATSLSFSIDRILGSKKIWSPVEEIDRETESIESYESRLSPTSSSYSTSPAKRDFEVELVNIDDPESGSEVSSRKSSSTRRQITPQQRKRLEELFSKDQYIDPVECFNYSKELQLSERQIKSWYQNRRSKEKRIQRRELSLRDNMQPYRRMTQEYEIMKGDKIITSDGRQTICEKRNEQCLECTHECMSCCVSMPNRHYFYTSFEQHPYLPIYRRPQFVSRFSTPY